MACRRRVLQLGLMASAALSYVDARMATPADALAARARTYQRSRVRRGNDTR